MPFKDLPPSSALNIPCNSLFIPSTLVSSSSCYIYSSALRPRRGGFWNGASLYENEPIIVPLWCLSCLRGVQGRLALGGRSEPSMSLDNSEVGYVPLETAGDDWCLWLYRHFQAESWGTFDVQIVAPYFSSTTCVPRWVKKAAESDAGYLEWEWFLFAVTPRFIAFMLSSCLSSSVMLVDGWARGGVGGSLKTRLEGTPVSSEELPWLSIVACLIIRSSRAERIIVS